MRIKIYIYALVFLLSLSKAWAANEAAVKAPPRTIGDIVRVLENSKKYDDEFIEAKKWIEKAVPTNASNDELNTFYLARSDAYAKLGQIDNAKKDLQQVIEKYPSKTINLQIQDLSTLAQFEASTGNLNLALKLVFSNRSKFGPNELPFFLGNNLVLVTLYSELGDFPAAEKYLLDSESTLIPLRRTRFWEELGGWWETSASIARGTYFFHQGKYAEAERQLRKSSLFMHDWLLNVEKLPINQPGADRTKSIYATAQLLRNVLPRRITTQHLFAQSLAMQGRLIEAEIQSRDALEVSLKYYGKTSLPVGTALLELSSIISEQNRFSEAELLAQAALTIFNEINASKNSLIVIKANRHLAKYSVAQKKYEQADKFFREVQAAFDLNQLEGKKVILNDVDWVLTKLKLNQHQEAHEMSNRLLASAKSQSNPSEKRIASLELLEALTLQTLGKSAEAETIYKKYMTQMIDAMSNDSESTSVGNREQDRFVEYLEGNLSLWAKLHNATKSASGSAKYADEAFSMADIARGSKVQKSLTASAARANIKDKALAVLARDEQDSQGRINSLEHLLSGLLSAPPEQQLPSVQEKLKQDIAQLKEHRSKLRKEIQAKFPDYAELTDPKPATLSKVRRQLKEDEVLVSWYFTDKEGFVWAITKSGAPQFHQVNLSRAKMAETVNKLRKSLDAGVASIDDIPAFDVALSHSLYKSILEPVQSALQGKKVLLTVPHAELGQLPLAVLVAKPDTQSPRSKGGDFTEYRKTAWLIKDIAIAQLPSVTALNALRNLPTPTANRREFVGFGDPYFSMDQAKIAANSAARAVAALNTRGVPLKLRNVPKTLGVSSAELALLPRLPDTKEEIQDIGKALSADPAQDIFLNKDASVSKVLEMDLSNRKVVMFATHGLVPGELDGLTQPALALSAPDVTGEGKGDGLLTMEQILTMKLNADWVVLSACNTASGEGAGAEAVSGLGRAFFYAGARALLVSNWPVDSEASRVLMTNMFKRQQEMQGKNKSEYLQASIVNMIESLSPAEAKDGKDSKAKAKYTYAHPLFWAPFVLVGD